MSNRYLQEATALIRDQQGPRGPIWMCGEQLQSAERKNRKGTGRKDGCKGVI